MLTKNARSCTPVAVLSISNDQLLAIGSTISIILLRGKRVKEKSEVMITNALDIMLRTTRVETRRQALSTAITKIQVVVVINVMYLGTPDTYYDLIGQVTSSFTLRQ